MPFDDFGASCSAWMVFRVMARPWGKLPAVSDQAEQTAVEGDGADDAEVEEELRQSFADEVHAR